MPSQNQNTWSEEYKIASFQTNLRGKAGLVSILNIVQDVGWLHAFKMNVSLPKNFGWVFTRQSLLMDHWPNWNETIRIKTWLRPVDQGVFFYRDYEIYLNDSLIGSCTSTLGVIDLESRKLVSPNIENYLHCFRSDSESSLIPEKILPLSSGEEVARYFVRHSDLDMNNHVNNTKYAQWILDSLPLEDLKGKAEIKKYEVNFLLEAKTGDEIRILQSHLKPKEEGNILHFEGYKAGNDRPLFTARLSIKKN